jgi:hypothetical protein
MKKFLWFYWPAALVFIALVLFAIPEYLALHSGGPTFSEFMATIAWSGPLGLLWIFAWGMLVGGLAVHFLGWYAEPYKKGRDE